MESSNGFRSTLVTQKSSDSAVSLGHIIGHPIMLLDTKTESGGSTEAPPVSGLIDG